MKNIALTRGFRFCLNRFVLLTSLVFGQILLTVPLHADTFGITRVFTFSGNPNRFASHFETWDDVANVSTPAAFTHGCAIADRIYDSGACRNLIVDGLALQPGTNQHYTFVLDDTDTPGLTPITSPNNGTPDEFRICLTTLDTTSGRLTPVNNGIGGTVLDNCTWIDDTYVTGAGFDLEGNLWLTGADTTSPFVQQVSVTSGQLIPGTRAALSSDASATYDIAFDSSGLALITNVVVATSTMQAALFDPTTLNVTVLDNMIAPVGFDANFMPPFILMGSAFTSHLAARNLDPDPAQRCRLNILESRRRDEAGHIDDPFQNSGLNRAYSDLLLADPPTVGETDIAGSFFPTCFDDYGDAPDSYGTLLASNGARHSIIYNLYLGTSRPDADFDGFFDGIDATPGSATGDDIDGTVPGDEEGAAMPASFYPGLPFTLPITVTGNGFMSAWIDWNADGDFLDAGEQIFNDDNSGSTTLFGVAPPGAVIGTSYARIRLCLTAQNCNTPTGPASGGEVEDYQILISEPEFFAIPAIGQVAMVCMVVLILFGGLLAQRRHRRFPR